MRFGELGQEGSTSSSCVPLREGRGWGGVGCCCGWAAAVLRQIDQHPAADSAEETRPCSGPTSLRAPRPCCPFSHLPLSHNTLGSCCPPWTPVVCQTGQLASRRGRRLCRPSCSRGGRGARLQAWPKGQQDSPGSQPQEERTGGRHRGRSASGEVCPFGGPFAHPVLGLQALDVNETQATVGSGHGSRLGTWTSLHGMRTERDVTTAQVRREEEAGKGAEPRGGGRGLPCRGLS